MTYGRSTRWLSLGSKWAAGLAAAHTVNIRRKRGTLHGWRPADVRLLPAATKSE
jgi:hypothetical protein